MSNNFQLLRRTQQQQSVLLKQVHRIQEGKKEEGRERRWLERYGEQWQGKWNFAETSCLLMYKFYHVTLLGEENHKIYLYILEITLKLKSDQDQPGCWEERGCSFNSSQIDAAKAPELWQNLARDAGVQKGSGCLVRALSQSHRGLQVWVTPAWSSKRWADAIQVDAEERIWRWAGEGAMPWRHNKEQGRRAAAIAPKMYTGQWWLVRLWGPCRSLCIPLGFLDMISWQWGTIEEKWLGQICILEKTIWSSECNWGERTNGKKWDQSEDTEITLEVEAWVQRGKMWRRREWVWRMLRREPRQDLVPS